MPRITYGDDPVYLHKFSRSKKMSYRLYLINLCSSHKSYRIQALLFTSLDRMEGKAKSGERYTVISICSTKHSKTRDPKSKANLIRC